MSRQRDLYRGDLANLRHADLPDDPAAVIGIELDHERDRVNLRFVNGAVFSVTFGQWLRATKWTQSRIDTVRQQRQDTPHSLKEIEAWSPKDDYDTTLI